MKELSAQPAEETTTNNLRKASKKLMKDEIQKMKGERGKSKQTDTLT